MSSWKPASRTSMPPEMSHTTMTCWAADVVASSTGTTRWRKVSIARSLCSATGRPYVHVPYFFSDVFDLSYEFWGDPSDADEVVERGDLASSSFSVWWLGHGMLAAAFVMNRPDEEREAAPRLIQSKEHISAETVPGND